METRRAGALVFQRDDLPRFPFPKKGEALSREQFVAFMIEDGTTDLAQKAFRDAVSEANVSWTLRTQNITERDGVIYGDFELPWEIHDRNSMSGSSISVRGEFTAESRDSLLELRRNDWVTVQGKLSFNGSSALLKDARLVSEALPTEAE
jgi:hypothetical protein